MIYSIIPAATELKFPLVPWSVVRDAANQLGRDEKWDKKSLVLNENKNKNKIYYYYFINYNIAFI